ncbi:MAG: tetratricopeptide repeat protein [Melioribacteraceae bacterium]
MKSLITILLILFFISSEGIAQYDCGSFEGCLSVGISAYQEENYEGAVGYLTNAIKNWKRVYGLTKLNSAYLYRGNSYLEMDSIKRAIGDYTQILWPNGKDPEAFRMRAKALEKQGNYDGALNDLTSVIKLEGKAEDYATRGIVYGKIEKFQTAIEDLTKAIALQPNWVDYYLKRAQIYYLMEKYDAALQDASKAQDLNAIIPDPYTFSATVYLKMEKFNEALEQMNSAITFAPEEAQLYATRGMVFNKLNKKDESIADLKKAVDMGFAEAKEILKSLYKIDY